jgi:hypothetical protein
MVLVALNFFFSPYKFQYFRAMMLAVNPAPFAHLERGGEKKYKRSKRTSVQRTSVWGNNMRNNNIIMINMLMPAPMIVLHI